MDIQGKVAVAANLADFNGRLSPAQVAADAVAAVFDPTGLVLPHPEVLDDLRGKTANHDRWLGGMQKHCARQATTLQLQAAP